MLALLGPRLACGGDGRRRGGGEGIPGRRAGWPSCGSSLHPDERRWKRREGSEEGAVLALLRPDFCTERNQRGVLQPGRRNRKGKCWPSCAPGSRAEGRGRGRVAAMRGGGRHVSSPASPVCVWESW